MLDKWMLRSNVGKKSEMPVLKLTLTVLAVAGCWRPSSWTSRFKHAIYNAYSAAIILILFIFAMTQLMEIILNADSINESTDALFNAMISFLACYKTILIRINHDDIMILTDNLNKEPFKPTNISEIIIREKFDKRITNNTLDYEILVSITIFYMISLSSFTNFKNGSLMYKAWVPFNLTSSLFYLTFAHQILAFIYIAFIHSACDNLICGLLLHICCQLEILEYRLSNIANHRGNLRDCVRHHICIFEYASILNHKCSSVIPSEFAMITVVMCYNLINLAFKSFNAVSYIKDIMMVISTLACIFYYCWFGNEIKIKSLQLSDSIYNLEWTSLSNDVKKGLLMMMNRTTIPIEFTSANIISASLDSFVMVLKTSYSIFNLLLHSSKQ